MITLISNKRGGGAKFAKSLNMDGGWKKRGGWDFVEKTNAKL